MFDRTITLFNYRKEDATWYGTIINGCTLTATDSTSNTARGMSNSSNVNIHVHCNADKTLKTASGGVKRYVSPKEFQRLYSVTDEFTFTPEVDFIVIDTAMVSLVVGDNDFENGFYHYMNHAYDNVFMITNAAWYNLIPHFVVGGR